MTKSLDPLKMGCFRACKISMQVSAGVPCIHQLRKDFNQFVGHKSHHAGDWKVFIMCWDDWGITVCWIMSRVTASVPSVHVAI